MTVPAEFVAEFEQERKARIARAAWVVTLITWAIYLPSFAIDPINGSDHLGELIVYRLVNFGILGLLLLFQLLLRRRGADVRLCRLTMWLMITFISASMDGFLLLPPGMRQPFSMGNPLLLVAVLVALPTRLWEALAIAAYVIVSTNLFIVAAVPDPDVTSWASIDYMMGAITFIAVFWVWTSEQMRVREFLGRKDLEREQARSDTLLLNVLPAGIATELKANGRVAARFIDSCTILFTDFVGFTKLAGSIPPERLVASLDRVFSRFDAVVAKYGIEKLKTIGDAYMCAAGVTGAQPDHLLRVLAVGLEMYAILDEETAADGKPWDMRLGVHPGAVVAGVIGQHRFAFDLWGDTVNTASRLTDVGEPRRITVETPVYRQVAPFFEGMDRGLVDVRGKGSLALTSLTRLRPEYSADAAGRVPNDRFLEAARSWSPAA